MSLGQIDKHPVVQLIHSLPAPLQPPNPSPSTGSIASQPPPPSPQSLGQSVDIQV